MPAGANPKREREYKELERKFKKEGRYGGRAQEVAARIVNKQRSEHGETRQAQEAERGARQGQQSRLPLNDFGALTVDEVKGRLDKLSLGEIRELRDYEAGHKRRKQLLAELDERLA